MTDRTLSNDVRLPAVGYGTFPLKAELVKAIPEAVDCGCRLIDVSDNYGNEEFAGRGLAAAAEGGAKVTVITKFSRPLKTRSLAKCFQTSVRRLGGRVDVYLLHWPYPFLWRRQWRKMEELYLSGACRAIGVCNFDREKLEQLLRFCRVKPMIDQFERHPLFQQRETADFCRANGIQVMSYSPFARRDVRLMENPVLVEIAARHGKTVGQVIVRWNVEHGDIPIPASRSAGHIRENFSVSDFSLSEEEVARIDALEAGVRVRFDPARRFTWTERGKFLLCWMKGCFGHA